MRVNIIYFCRNRWLFIVCERPQVATSRCVQGVLFGHFRTFDSFGAKSGYFGLLMMKISASLGIS